ncbi:alginate biosynthesis protein Alg44 [Pseudomonas sp. GV071]|jgi:alginate biosynthesis protein Alg44|uniref:alginate biosynthesis protein Alg44 n=1 Tax=Pseudomonas sp. GV071 TaxID=2135754 RepID=UPI000D355200|nr:alginate biosynthesis protein Alg44 [Pseudomonas sp. GV071]PTQ71750.1 alginate biosynthesis protein Alg44 [Pseudomonas sp. GV071]
MNTAVNVNVVHESEAQRQHARVRLPAKIRFSGKNREVVEQTVMDISAGGFSYGAVNSNVRVGDFHKGKMLFVIDNITLAIDVEFQVRSVDFDANRIGCQFSNLRPREISTLRHLITAHLSGELVSVGELLTTLQRENFTKARKQKLGSGMSAFARLRAVTFSIALFVVGLLAFGFLFKSIYSLYFVTHAQSALVQVPGMQVTMPREGTVQSLIGADGLVKKGAPIATFSASMLEMLKGHLDDKDLSPSNVANLFNKQMKGTLTSPCDCVLAKQYVADGQYASKGDVIFDLVSREAKAQVEARFPYSKFNEIKPGARVNFQVAGLDDVRGGKVISSSLNDTGNLSSDIRVVIQPDEPLENALGGRPVEVSSDNGPSFGWLMDKAMAAGL